MCGIGSEKARLFPTIVPPFVVKLKSFFFSAACTTFPVFPWKRCMLSNHLYELLFKKQHGHRIVIPAGVNRPMFKDEEKKNQMFDLTLQSFSLLLVEGVPDGTFQPPWDRKQTCYRRKNTPNLKKVEGVET